MEHTAASSEVTIHHEPGQGTKKIWKTFWLLLFITVIELALGFFMYFIPTLPSWIVLFIKGVIVILSLAKAFYIVSIFMHLGDEIKNLIMTIVVPLMLFIWFIGAFLWDGNYYRTQRNTYDKSLDLKTIQAPSVKGDTTKNCNSTRLGVQDKSLTAAYLRGGFFMERCRQNNGEVTANRNKPFADRSHPRRKVIMNKKAMYAVMLGLIVPLLAFFIMKFVTTNQVPHRLFYDEVKTRVEGGKRVDDTIWSKVPDFKFTNQLGQQVSWKDLEGKIVVADFFFTRCPVICPTMTRNIKRLQDAVKTNARVGNREAKFVQFISFTVDPEYDSVEVLKQYADRYQINPQNWWLLTGPKKEIYDLALKGMKLGITETEVDTAFIHPQKFILIDKDRVIRTRKDQFGNPRLYNGMDSADVKNIAEDIILLTLEKDRKKKFFLIDKLPLIGVVFAMAILGLFVMFYFLKRRRMNLTLAKNDKKARLLIFSFSAIVFLAVTVLERVTLNINIGFDPHLLALTNAIINTGVALLLIAGLIAAKQRAFAVHKKIMLAALSLSVIFLVVYIAHHLFAGSTWYGDADRNGVVDDVEKAAAGVSRPLYFILLSTHILLAGISLPFILFTAYRGLTNDNIAHRKIAKITWPMWFYVAVTGPVVYLMISRYY